LDFRWAKRLSEESNRNGAKSTGSTLACGIKREFYKGVLSVSLKVMAKNYAISGVLVVVVTA
jgi:hypothetical protein